MTSGEIDYQGVLLEMLDRLLAEPSAFEELSKAYHDFYIDDVPDAAMTNEGWRWNLTNDPWEFFGNAQERLSWTSAEPTQEARSDGLISEAEYLDWLKEEREAYRRKFGR